jgi:predicted nucleic acid-binding protein
MLAVDTNLVVRYLTGDHPEQSPRAKALINGQPVFITLTVILETEWVLRSTYRVLRADIIKKLRAFAGLPTVTIESGSVLAAALDLAEKDVDLADALHLCASSHCTGFATFDRDFVKAAQEAGYATVREA